ncbi:MAG: hypothetical protein FWE32_02090 [Oscillospiraceae bacterium]|nr:hypothetical protein [Oscillospiraceae bacterium]
MTYFNTKQIGKAFESCLGESRSFENDHYGASCARLTAASIFSEDSFFDECCLSFAAKNGQFSLFEEDAVLS